MNSNEGVDQKQKEAIKGYFQMHSVSSHQKWDETNKSASELKT
jgi:hypothetical protein